MINYFLLLKLIINKKFLMITMPKFFEFDKSLEAFSYQPQ